MEHLLGVCDYVISIFNIDFLVLLAADVTLVTVLSFHCFLFAVQVFVRWEWLSLSEYFGDVIILHVLYANGLLL